MSPSLLSLISLRRPHDDPPDPEDIFSSSLGVIFTNDLQNSHGDDSDTVIVYRSHKFGNLEFRTADVNGEEQRRKFAHYLWNAGILAAELIGGRRDDGVGHRDSGNFENGAEGEGDDDDGEWGRGEWWVGKEEEKLWSVKGESVLELGAGVGLAGIASALSGAEEVAISDYPAPPILAAITTNVAKNIDENIRSRVAVQGHMWGDLDTSFAIANAHRFTRIIAADCLWMPDQHDNLALSMLHFLSESPHARVFCIAGFHTGRVKLAPFFEETLPERGLEIEEIYEMDAYGKRREWKKERDGMEDISRNRWLVLARLRRRAT